MLALKPINLERCEIQKAKPPPPKAKPASASASASRGAGRSATQDLQDAIGGLSWQQCVVAGLVIWWASGLFGRGGGGSLSLDGGEFADGGDDSYLEGLVTEARTHQQFLSALAQHRDDTGLPVIVDFYSDGCGPCRMIAPAYTQLAQEYAGKAVFLKVDTNRNWETSQVCQVSAMPTFQFYLNGQRVQQFQGADSQGLRHYTDGVVRMAEQQGTYVGVEVTTKVMEDFYRAHPPGKNATAASIALKYKGKTAKLMRLLHEKYNAVPTPVAKKRKPRPRSKVQATSLGKASTEELQEELQRRKEEDAAYTEDPFSDPAALGTSVHKVVVVGGGPAGLSAAIYAARSGLDPVVVAPREGGQLLQKGVDVENYPGVHGQGATGREIIEGMRRQAKGFQTVLVDDAVAAMDLQQRPFKLTLNKTGEIRAHALILATGADSRWLGVPGEDTYRGGGVSSCATCDGFLFRGKSVAVIGGGDSAMEDALVLARTSERVTVVHRRDKFRSIGVLAQRVLSHDKIEVVWNAEVAEFTGEEGENGPKLRGITLAMKGGGTQQLAVDAAFVAIGHKPNTQPMAGHLEMDSQGYLLRPQKYSAKTSVEGVFAAGDVQDKVYRQAVTSAGTGAMAALDAERWLSEQGKVSAA